MLEKNRKKIEKKLKVNNRLKKWKNFESYYFKLVKNISLVKKKIRLIFKNNEKID